MDTSPTETAKGKWFTENLKGLNVSNCKFTSKSTWDYNCVGFAVGDYQWWHWKEQREHYWPDGIKRSPMAKVYVEALKTAHFEVCPVQNADPEPDYEKIAVFHKGGR